MVTLTPIFPAKAGTQIQPRYSSSPARPSPRIWAPAFAGEIGFGEVV